MIEIRASGLLALALTCSLVHASACDLFGRPAFGASCAAEADCSDGFRCIEEQCVPVGTSASLKLVSACDQTGLALNGAQGFEMLVARDGTNQTLTFVEGEGPPPVDVTDGPSITVRAFPDDVSGGADPGDEVQAIGRTVPLENLVGGQEGFVLVTMGQPDSFGRTTNSAGQCTSMTASAARQGRHAHTATFVPVLNQVLIYGGAVFGADGTESFLATAELFDPLTGEFSELGGVNAARAYHAATALPDGRVLITGGLGVVEATHATLQTGVIFNPTTRDFQTIGLKQARAHHTSTLMSDVGLVAIVGGCSGTGPAGGCTPTSAGPNANSQPSTDLSVTVETFDINGDSTETVAVTSSLGLATGRAFHRATSLDNGSSSVLIVTGGANADGAVNGIEVFRAEGHDLQRLNTPELANFPSGKAPVRHAAVALDAQTLLIIGGQTQAPGGAPSGPGSAEAFMFTTGAGANPSPISLFNGSGRVGHVAARLNDGSVLVVGGTIGATGANAEVLAADADTGVLTSRLLAGAAIGGSRDLGALAVLPNNQFLFTGGHSTTAPFTTSSSAEWYFAR